MDWATRLRVAIGDSYWHKVALTPPRVQGAETIEGSWGFVM